ncbi:hypothetical protein OROMI_014376 [Orobanche minor]
MSNFFFLLFGFPLSIFITCFPYLPLFLAMRHCSIQNVRPSDGDGKSRSISR